MATDITIRSDLRPGDLGRIIALHGDAYLSEKSEFGLTFEAYVARTIAEFVIDNAARGKVFLAERGPTLVGCAAMVERSAGDDRHGQLRWVLTAPAARGLGLGKKLVQLAIDHARLSGWRTVFLETTAGLDASMAIYRRLGFVEEARSRQRLWTDADEVITMRLPLN